MIAWYSFNGDLHNLGVGDMDLTATPSFVDGKTGKCILFNGSNYASALWKYGNLDEFSISMWVYLDKSQTCSLGTCRTIVGLGFSVFVINNIIRFDIGDTLLWTIQYSIPITTWTHLTFVRSRTEAIFYINGVKISNITYTSKSASNFGNTFSIGASQANGNGYGNYLTGKICDYRIFDYCLTPKQVKEISKGLILHYPLNLIDGYTCGRNLARNTSNKWKLIGSPTGSTNLCYYTGNIYTDGLNVGDQVTVSFDYKYEDITIVADKTGYASFLSAGNITGWTSGNIGKRIITNPSGSDEIHFTYTFTVTDEHLKNEYWPANIRHDYLTGKIYIKNVTAVKCSNELPWTPAPEDANYDPIIYDTSGFGNNGTITGTLTTDFDTPVGLCSTIFKNKSYINAGRGTMVTDAITISMWCKGFSSRPISCTEGGGWNFEAAGGGLNFALYEKDVGYSTNVVIPKADFGNGWNLITGTYDGYTKKFYLNGQLKGSVTTSTTKRSIGYNANNAVFISAEAAGNANTPASFYDSLLADVRIYATALSEADIKELYQTRFSIDDNLYCTEYVESTNVKFNKTGILNSLNLSENLYILDTKILEDGSAWAKVFYHNNKSGTKLFKFSDDFANKAVIMDEDRQSRLHLILNFNDDGFEFLVIQEGVLYRWKLSNNPVTNTSAGTVTKVEGYNYDSNGLMECSGNTWLAHSTSTGNWWCAIGCCAKYSSGIPGWGGKTVTGELELWVRISLNMKQSKCLIYKDTIVTKELIEC